VIQLEQLGFSPFFQAQCELMNQPALVPARVAADARDLLPIVGATAPWAHASGRLRLAIETGEAVHPAVGDWLLITDEGDDAVIHHVLDRRTSLKRRAAGSNVREQVIAANVDVFFIVTAVGRDFNPRRVERYLTAVWDSGASPVVVLNKTDLAECTESLLNVLGEVALAVPVVSVSAKAGDGIDALRIHIGKGSTAAFIGSSGVGKSTLVNRLLDREQQSTSPVGVAGKGKHTTSRRELITLPGGGVLIDTPGLREFGLVELDGVDVTFADIAAFSTSCHFADCTHTEEPDCAVIAAVTAGELSAERLASYVRLRNEAAVMQARRSSSQANNSKRRWKSIHKGAKEFYKISTKYR
jgi:ribosome biogenesis GTPase